LKRAFNLGVEDGLLTHAPKIPTPNARNVRQGFFEEADLQAIIVELPYDLKPVVRFASLVGGRKSEILSLRWSQVERDLQVIVTHVFHGNGASIGCIRGAWDAACKRAGLEGAWFHDLRRTAVRGLEMAGVSRSVAMKITGHKTEAVYRRYAIVDRKAIEEGMEKIHEFRQEQAERRAIVPMRKKA
jgi:integrase